MIKAFIFAFVVLLVTALMLAHKPGKLGKNGGQKKPPQAPVAGAPPMNPASAPPPLANSPVPPPGPAGDGQHPENHPAVMPAMTPPPPAQAPNTPPLGVLAPGPASSPSPASGPLPAGAPNPAPKP